ncbi:MAG TPA: endonuclease III domain-containing protein, partial [Candidatus Cloacimonadota bacterium]|nr:endonuclease III domain-containing protein [Candidatus Cloacimonadota bacterium]
MSAYPCHNLPFTIQEIYSQLFERYGTQHWWPGESHDEIIIGAILTQNTNWSNVSKAISNLKKANACDLKSCAEMDTELLEELIKPSGFFRIKAKRLQQASIEILKLSEKKHTLHEFRKELLSIHGIGPETADSILLYAFELPVFVIDAYTKRIFSRMGKTTEKSTYHEIQEIFHHSLPLDIALFNEYHALIVRHAKEVCRKKPDCEH